MKTKGWILYTLMLAQAFGLVASYAYHASGRDAKMVIRLEVAPVDPRDLIRGDYIILRYPGLDTIVNSRTVDEPLAATSYVTLKQTGNLWTGVEVRTSEPDDGTAFLLVKSNNGNHPEYGIETYYVPEGKGRPRGKLVMEVAVRADGQAQIRQLFCDGKPWP